MERRVQANSSVEEGDQRLGMDGGRGGGGRTEERPKGAGIQRG